MGSFDRTCAVTRVNIHAGDPIYIVWWGVRPPLMGDSPYDPRRSTYELFQALHRVPKMRWPISEHLDDEAEMVWGWETEHIRLFHGEYDDYGWVEGDDTDDRELQGRERDRQCFWVHEYVVLEICRMLNVDPEGDPLLVVRAIAEFAMRTRIQLFAQDWLLGAQFGDPDEWGWQHKMLTLMGQMLTAKEAEYAYEFREED